jgi:hypothetical protein
VSTALGQVTAQQCAEVGLDELDLRTGTRPAPAAVPRRGRGSRRSPR